MEVNGSQKLGSEDENKPLFVDDNDQPPAEKEKDVVTRRTLVVEPLLLTYMLAGAPMESLQSQYMYERIARDMGIDLYDLTGNVKLRWSQGVVTDNFWSQI